MKKDEVKTSFVRGLYPSPVRIKVRISPSRAVWVQVQLVQSISGVIQISAQKVDHDGNLGRERRLCYGLLFNETDPKGLRESEWNLLLVLRGWFRAEILEVQGERYEAGLLDLPKFTTYHLHPRTGLPEKYQLTTSQGSLHLERVVRCKVVDLTLLGINPGHPFADSLKSGGRKEVTVRFGQGGWSRYPAGSLEWELVQILNSALLLNQDRSS